MTNSTERALVERFLSRGDEEAFRLLFGAATPPLLGFLRRLAASDAEAEELVQETWVRAIQRLSSFRSESSLATWLRGIGLNCWRESRRGRERLVPLAEEDGAGLGPAPRLDAVDAVGLSRAIDGLPDGYRAVLVLHDIEGFSHEEIAARLEIAEGTSKSQLHRARAALRRRLAPRIGGRP